MFSFRAEEFCATPCEWIDAIKTCYDPAVRHERLASNRRPTQSMFVHQVVTFSLFQIGYDCNLWSNTGECPEEQCKAAGQFCLDKEQPVDCSSFWSV